VPIYDYVCETCGHVMEVVHRIDADGPGECPLCGGPMSKAFSAPAVHFKGSGWAKKDRKSVSGPVRSRAGSDGADRDASTASAGSSGGGDGAPATSTSVDASAATAAASGTGATSTGEPAGSGPKEG
jgi:putative FmdB family regulatory protein